MTHALAGKKQTPEHIAKRVASCKKTGRSLRDRKEILLKKVFYDKSGCWVWIGSVFKKKYGNYGQIRLGRKNDNKLYRAHRISYQEFVGNIPDGNEIDHLCHNTLCINPKHLEAVSHQTNMKRRKDSGLKNCKHGHLYTKETTYINPRGVRECKTCKDITRKKSI